MFQGNAFQGNALNGSEEASQTTAGYRGLLAFWAGGAASAGSVSGYRGLLAFWSGGAALSGAVTTHLHGRPPRVRRRRGRLDREWCEALEAAIALRKEIDPAVTPRPETVTALKNSTAVLLGLVDECNPTLVPLVQSLTDIVRSISERKARIEADALLVRLEAELRDEEEAVMLLLLS